MLAERLDLGEGDRLELPTPKGIQSLVIAGVFYDYRTEGGMVIMDRSTFHRYWPEERRYTSVGIYFEPGTNLDQTRTLIRNQLKKSQGVFVTSNRELRKEILRIFDQTFSITYALQVIAIVVAIFGIVNTLVLLVMERERDIGILKAVGATDQQVQRMTLLEAGLMGLISFRVGSSKRYTSFFAAYFCNQQAILRLDHSVQCSGGDVCQDPGFSSGLFFGCRTFPSPSRSEEEC